MNEYYQHISGTIWQVVPLPPKPWNDRMELFAFADADIGLRFVWASNCTERDDWNGLMVGEVRPFLSGMVSDGNWTRIDEEDIPLKVLEYV